MFIQKHTANTQGEANKVGMTVLKKETFLAIISLTFLSLGPCSLSEDPKGKIAYL